MTRSSLTARRRAVALITIGATTAAGISLLGPGTSSASSHREAPYTASDPAIDNTDVYAFTSPDKPTTATLIANWTPFQEPSGGPNFYPWATDAAYDINVDNNGDAKPDITYRWTFTDVDKRGTTSHGDTVPGTFLYNDGPVTSFNDPTLLFKQTYKLEKITYPGGAPTATTLLPAGQVAPSNVGTASIPDYSALRQQAVASGALAGGGQSYVGQVADPFFLDLRVFDLLYGGNLKEVGFNTLKNFNVNTISLQVPKSELAALGNATANPNIGVWSTTSRYATRTLAATDAAGAETTSGQTLTQVSRLGNPLVNEAVVPAQLKDLFNRSTPAQDVAHGFAGKVSDPELPYLIKGIYKIPNPNETAGGKNRPDLVAAFLTGIPGLNSLGDNAVAKGANAIVQQPAEYLRLNLGTAPTAKPNRLGVIAGDSQGFPNGRRLGDDVIDIALQVLEGVLVPDQPADIKAAVKGLGDGVSGPSKPYQGGFPYAADPYAGSDAHVGQVPVTFRQVFKSTPGVIETAVINISMAQPGSYAELYKLDNRTNTYSKVATVPLDATGYKTSHNVTLRQPTGTAVVLVWKVFVNHGSAQGMSEGLVSSVTSR